MWGPFTTQPLLRKSTPISKGKQKSRKNRENTPVLRYILKLTFFKDFTLFWPFHVYNLFLRMRFLYLNALLIFGGIPANNSEIRPFFLDLNKHSSNYKTLSKKIYEYVFPE
jgi:hypothetical protein